MCERRCDEESTSPVHQQPQLLTAFTSAVQNVAAADTTLPSALFMVFPSLTLQGIGDGVSGCGKCTHSGLWRSEADVGVFLNDSPR